MMFVGKKPIDALPKRTIMKIIVVTAFESRFDRKLVKEGMKSRVLSGRVVPQALDRSMADTFMGESELDRSRN